MQGIEDVGIFNIKGQTNLEFRVDPEKCKQWGVQVADVNNVVQTALGGKALSTMIEGEKMLRHHACAGPERRSSETTILDIPVDVTNNQVVSTPGRASTPQPRSGTGAARPAVATPAAMADTTQPASRNTPRAAAARPGDAGRRGRPARPQRQFRAAGASTIYREQGNRLIAIKFSVRGRDLAGAVAEAKAKTDRPLPGALPGRVERRVRGDGGGRSAGC